MSTRALPSLVAVIAVSVGALSAVGVKAHRRLDSVTVTSPRGETYAMVTSGVYAFNHRAVVAEGIGWDVFTLFFAVPALLATVDGLRKGRFRSRLVALGLLAYVFYQYLMYAMTWAFGPLFVPFVLVFASAWVAIAWLALEVARDAPEEKFQARFPRGLVVGLALAVAVILTGMWSARIVTALSSRDGGGMLFGGTTMVIQAMDLGLIVPLALLTAWLTWQRSVLGYVLAAVVVVKAIAMSLAIVAMLVGSWLVVGTLQLGPVLLFLAIAAYSVFLGARILAATAKASPGEGLRSRRSPAASSKPAATPPFGLRSRTSGPSS